MVKSSKFKQYAKEYGVSVLSGGAVLLSLMAVATSLHHFLMLTSIAICFGTVIYLLWRISDA